MACNRCEKHKRKWEAYRDEIEQVHKDKTKFLKKQDKINSLLEKVNFISTLKGNELKKDLIEKLEEINELSGDFE